MSDEKQREGAPVVARGDKQPMKDEKKPYRGGMTSHSAYHDGKSGSQRAFGGREPSPEGFKDRNSGNKAQFKDEKRSFGGNGHANHHDFHGNGGEKRYGRPTSNAGSGRRPAGNVTPGRRPMGNPGTARGFQKKRPALPTDGLPARRLALDVIRQVTENGAYASLALDEKLRGCGLSPEDRRLVSRLVYDTLEHLLYLDYAIGQVMAKPDTDIKLRNVLRLGACQILLEDRIPESAATNTSVNLCKELGMEGLAGVCNGILRNLIRQKDELSWPDEQTEPVKALSIRHSVPEWLVERLLADWGHDEAVALMSAHVASPYLTLRPNLMKLSDEAFEKLLETKVWQREPGKVPHAWRIRGMADIALDIDFAKGNYSIQSESSMMACMAVEPRPGMNVLDCCAAPGGKTCYMAEMMNGTGRVYAWDVHPHRADLVAAQARRLQLDNVRPVARDALKKREELLESMDAVLLDAPCSGTGDMQDKPDVKYRASEESLQELTKTQHDLLDTVCTYVKRGGVLVYSTCSVLKDENERQVAAFLERHPEFTLEKLPESIPEGFRAQEGVGLQLLPHRDGVGGFYIARMRRKRV